MIGVLFSYSLLVCLFSVNDWLDEEQLNFQDLEFEQQLARETGKCSLIILNLIFLSVVLNCMINCETYVSYPSIHVLETLGMVIIILWSRVDDCQALCVLGGKIIKV